MTRSCDTCDGHVSVDYWRVFSDSDGVLHACPHCSTRNSRLERPVFASRHAVATGSVNSGATPESGSDPGEAWEEPAE